MSTAIYKYSEKLLSQYIVDVLFSYNLLQNCHVDMKNSWNINVLGLNFGTRNTQFQQLFSVLIPANFHCVVKLDIERETCSHSQRKCRLRIAKTRSEP